MYLWKKAVSLCSAMVLYNRKFIYLQLYDERLEKFDESFRVLSVPLKQVVFRRF